MNPKEFLRLAGTMYSGAGRRPGSGPGVHREEDRWPRGSPSRGRDKTESAHSETVGFLPR